MINTLSVTFDLEGLSNDEASKCKCLVAQISEWDTEATKENISTFDVDQSQPAKES